MPNETHIHFKRKGVEDYLKKIALAWRAKFPQRAKAYEEVLKDDKKGMVNPSGMSKCGNLRFTGAVPVDVFHVIIRKYPYFFRDPKNVRTFQEIFLGKYAPERIL